MEKLKFDYYKQMFARMFDFRGRSNLKEYWIVVLYNIFFSLCTVLIALPFAIDFNVFYKVSISLASLYELVLFIPMLALTVRRLHDANHTSRSFLWLLLPFVGEIIFIIYLASPSNTNINFWPFQNQTKEPTNDINFVEETKTEEISPEMIEESQNDTTNTNQSSTDSSNLESDTEKNQPIKVDENKISIEDTSISRSERIKTLQKLHDSGEITEEEYQKKVIEILKK